MAKERAVVVGAGGISGAWFPPLLAEKIDVAGVVDLNLKVAKNRDGLTGLCKATVDFSTYTVIK